MLEKTFESPWDFKEIKPVHPKGNQSWIFIGRTDAEAETPNIWPPDAKKWLIWKDPDGNDNPVCETAKETQMYRTVFWTLGEKARVGWFERIALKHVYYHMWNRSPVKVRFMRQGVQGWCPGMTQRDGMGREVEWGLSMGNTSTPMADSYQCMVKTTTIL